MTRKLSAAALVVAALVLAGFLAASGPVRAQLPAAGSSGAPASGLTYGQDYHHDTSPPLRDLPPVPIKPQAEHEANRNPPLATGHKDVPDASAVQRLLGPLAMPAPILNFDGIAYPGVGCNCAPPDTNGEVGATQYVQMVNRGFQVFDKTTGATVLTARDIATIWLGFGGACEVGGKGDPVVLYDQLAGRWLISQFATATGGQPITDECIAVSTTSDATGTYNRYGFHLGSNFFDYPHLGVWPDAYYMSDNVFTPPAGSYLGPQPFAFDRSRMLAGLSATFVSPVGPLTGNATFLPADLDGSLLPAAGAPESFVQFPAGGAYTTYHFHVDFTTPANSTWTTFATPAAAGFTQACTAGRACVPELGAAPVDYLDGIGDRLMFRLAYRKFGDGHESVLGNYTVSSGGVTGVRWFELRNVTAGPVTVFQESTYQPDTTWRWLGSIAQDQFGSMALGFSASSATISPQILYAGRLATDPLNQLTQGEAHLIDGAGSQTGSGNRWGDYSDMTVDPVDDSTFWYTQEYYAATGAFNWRTRIGSFKFPTLPTPTVTSIPSNTPTATVTPTITPTAAPTCPPSITQSLSLTPVSGNSTACSNGLITAENHYYRAFTMSSYVPSGSYAINSVDVGIEVAAAPSGSQPLSVILYTSSTNPPTLASLSAPLATANLTIANQNLTVINVPIVATVTSSSILVVEVSIPDGAASSNEFFIGSNAAGQTGPSYIRAPACGITDITNLAAIGFPNMDIIMRVNGTCAVATVTATPTATSTWVQWTATPDVPGAALAAPGLYFDAGNNSQVFVGGASGVEGAYRGADGSQLWHQTIGAAIYNRGPIIPINGTNVACFTSSDGFVNALKSADGTSFWAGGGHSIGSSAVAGVAYLAGIGPSGHGLIFAGTYNNGAPTNKFVALDAFNGTQFWQFTNGGSLGIVTTNPAVNPTLQRVYFGTKAVAGVGQGIWALNAVNGAVLWSRTDIGGANTGNPTLSDDGSTLYIAANNGASLYALNTNTGATQPGAWPFNPPGGGLFSGAPWFDGSFLYVSAGNAVYSLVAASGANNPAWPTGGAAVPGAGTPLVLSDSRQSVYVSTNNGRLDRLALANGLLAETLNLGTNVAVSNPTYDFRRNAFYVTSNGVLYSINGNW